MRGFATRSSQSGSALVSVLIGFAMIATLMAASASYFSNVRSAAHKNDIARGVRLAAQNLKAMLSNSTAWKETIQRNASMLCLTTSAACSKDNQKLAIYSPSGVLFFEAASQSSGFDLTGKPCAPNSDACPVRVSVNWRPECGGGGGGTCPADSVKVIDIMFQLAPELDKKYIFNPGNYNATLYKP